ncbi:MAG: N-acetyl-gamma-glutamyl-phosphate reductase, partial [bacterium]|nr:N-acetyl-gamma-glutamyl-phosphate reductase [bacterium]
MKIAILGATGYTGLELVRILSQHPKVAIVALTSEKSAGEKFSTVHPALRSVCDLTLEPLHPEKIL